MIWSDAQMLLFGFLLLGIGGEMLVRGSVKIAEEFGASEYFIGVVLIGFGSSMPELVTTIQAAASQASGIAIGNIVGSNIANIILVLGLTAVAWPIDLARLSFRFDGLVLFAVVISFVVITNISTLTPIVGGVLLVGLFIYLYYLHDREFHGKHGQARLMSLREKHQKRDRSYLYGSSIPLALSGLVVLIVAADLVVDGAVGVARDFAVSEAVIGLTIVAVGTTLPEICTALIAAYHKHNEVVMGTVIGSCIYNILAVVGIVSIVTPTSTPTRIIEIDNFVMLFATAMLAFLLAKRLRIGRPLALAMLSGYACYIIVLARSPN